MRNESHLDREGEREEVLQALYDRVLSSICVDLACDVHREIKTSQDPFGLLQGPLKNRRELYPTVHTFDEEGMQQSLKYHATDTPLSLTDVQPSTRLAQLPLRHQQYQPQATLPSQQPQQEGSQERAMATANKPESEGSTVVTRHQQSHIDIWGNTPPKEPKTLATCSICGRKVSALRFAPHLDKCMGIGTTVRAAAANTTVSGAGSY